MWQYLYLRATEIAAERERDAMLARLARVASHGRTPLPSTSGRVLRWGVSVARQVVGRRPGSRTVQPGVRAVDRAGSASGSPSPSPAVRA
jgi:hypothetical protein